MLSLPFRRELLLEFTEICTPQWRHCPFFLQVSSNSFSAEAHQVAHLAFFGGGGSGVTSIMAAGYCRMKSFDSDAGASSQASYNPSGMITTMRLVLRLGRARRVGPVHVLYQVVIVGVSIVKVLTYPGDFHGWQRPAPPKVLPSAAVNLVGMCRCASRARRSPRKAR